MAAAMRRLLPRATCRAFSSTAVSATSAGTLYMCGTGESHKLGLGDTKDRETPVLVEALADVPIARVACGKYHSAALTASGDVYAWGLNDYGQLGLGKAASKNQTTPAKVE